jgi:hypothetical protein
LLHHKQPVVAGTYQGNRISQSGDEWPEIQRYLSAERNIEKEKNETL